MDRYQNNYYAYKLNLILQLCNGHGTTLHILQVVLLDVMEETGQEICTELRKKYGDDKVVFYKCDVTLEEDLVSVFIQDDVQRCMLNCLVEICLCTGDREIWQTGYCSEQCWGCR